VGEDVFLGFLGALQEESYDPSEINVRRDVGFGRFHGLPIADESVDGAVRSGAFFIKHQSRCLLCVVTYSKVGLTYAVTVLA